MIVFKVKPDFDTPDVGYKSTMIPWSKVSSDNVLPRLISFSTDVSKEDFATLFPYKEQDSAAFFSPLANMDHYESNETAIDNDDELCLGGWQNPGYQY